MTLVVSEWSANIINGDASTITVDPGNYATFTVEADAEGNVNDVNLLFSTGSTFPDVSATGSGRVMLAPVIGQSGEGGA